MVRRAHELDPLTHRADVATTLLRAGRHDEALQAALACVEFDPDYGRGRSTLGWAYLYNGMAEKGIAELERAVTLMPGHPLYLAQLGEAYGLTGRAEEARESAAPAAGDVRGTVRLALPPGLRLHRAGRAGYGDRAAWSEAYEERAGSVYGIKGSFLFTSLKEHPRFQALLAKMNLA